MSEAIPSAGFAVIPEYESDPPHCNAIFNSDIDIFVRVNLLNISSSSIIFFETLLIISLVPPSS